jgi:DNA-binding NarL/FixJ family response regulator
MVLRARLTLGMVLVGKCILIVDDNPVIRRALRQLLEQVDSLEVCGEAANGREAIAKARRLKPNLVVLDFRMPGMNGLDAARGIKHLLPALPVVMFTAFPSTTLVREALSAGVNFVVSKSEPGDLVGRIQALFGS